MASNEEVLGQKGTVYLGKGPEGGGHLLKDAGMGDILEL